MAPVGWREEWRRLAARVAEHQSTMLLGLVYLFVLGPLALPRRVAAAFRRTPGSTWIARSPVTDLLDDLKRPY